MKKEMEKVEKEKNREKRNNDYIERAREKKVLWKKRKILDREGKK